MRISGEPAVIKGNRRPEKEKGPQWPAPSSPLGVAQWRRGSWSGQRPQEIWTMLLNYVSTYSGEVHTVGRGEGMGLLPSGV